MLLYQLTVEMYISNFQFSGEPNPWLFRLCSSR